MRPKRKRRFLCIPVILCVILLFSSCGKDTSASNDTKKSNRDNEPVVLTGSADGTVTYGNESVTIDASHTQNGYNYVISNFTYDYDKAATVQSGYLPDVEDLLDF